MPRGGLIGEAMPQFSQHAVTPERPAVARRYGLHASQLFVWRQQLQRRAASSAETIGAPGFVPVLLAEDSAPPAEAAGRMEIALGPAVVRVGVDVDGPALRRVLEVVRGLA